MLQHASALPSFLQVINIPSEKAMAPHSSALAWKILWTEEPGGLQSMGSLESGTTERLHFPFSLSCTGEGNSNPLQCSCLENPRDGGACWSAVYGVAQSRTRLKQLSSSSSNIPLYRYTAFSLSIHQLMDTWVVSTFWLSQTMLLIL